MSRSTPAGTLSIAKGIPLSEEPGLGALTLPGYLREVTTRFAEREALVMRTPDGVERWTYAMLWERAVEVARALLAAGVGKDSRVGVMMTNRPEWIAAVFGTGLAGGVAVTLSTFSTAAELEYLLQVSSVSILLFERTVLKKDFATLLGELEPQIYVARPGELASVKFPFLRRLAAVDYAPGSGGGVGAGRVRTGSVGAGGATGAIGAAGAAGGVGAGGATAAAGAAGAAGAIESWSAFLSHGQATARELVDATAATVTPADTGVLFFSSGSTSKPKGILSSHRAVTIQCWRWRRMLGLQDDVRCWSANGFFWSGNFGMALGATFSSGGSLVLQATFVPAEALELMQAERVTVPHAWPHQWAQLEAAPNWSRVDLSSLRYVDVSKPAARHPTVSTRYLEPRWAYGNTETFTINCCFPSDSPAALTGESHGVPLPGNTLKIVDPRTGAVLPRRERGEIAIKGPTLMLGYIGIPVNETLDEDGFFHTGDGGYMDEAGRLFWEGRLTDIIKTGGANVSPLEIDDVLANYPGIKLARTVGLPHDTLGEVVVSCVVPHAGIALEEAAIREFLKQRLASYKVPRRVLFIREDELSMTGTAKVKSSSLRELAAKRLSADAG